MREPLEIIAGIRNFISSQNPMRFPHQKTILVDLLNELENTLNPQPIVEEVVIIEEPVVEEPIIEVVEETVTEEPTVEVVAPKATTRKK
jgi:hypothetical protein